MVQVEHQQTAVDDHRAAQNSWLERPGSTPRRSAGRFCRRAGLFARLTEQDAAAHDQRDAHDQ
jgi:hypothetical protein